MNAAKEATAHGIRNPVFLVQEAYYADEHEDERLKFGALKHDLKDFQNGLSSRPSQ